LRLATIVVLASGLGSSVYSINWLAWKPRRRPSKWNSMLKQCMFGGLETIVF
jgi:hypothetical protein